LNYALFSVLSGDLFNCFIDYLIEECCNSGLGAKFVEIILCILGFCDDICLISGSSDELRLLLLICEKFALKWAIEFNISKCKFIVFGSTEYKKKLKKIKKNFALAKINFYNRKKMLS
jgi:hypothetical protein